ncbi:MULTISPECIES: response regulator [Paenibacillus]|uniref:response regulator n=1 Tax=Paenibacillus TaxID=44249 RepID=UPI0022B91A56|nr:response regulator [Paenibacillus caseinilyticus]MCZ8519830.1 response regulator [Paenibacillus caseinilyticus]
MHRLIIVDDEVEVLEGLKNTIDWHALGFELIGDYTNGRQAWEAVETLKPDLVVTDISMPFMNGLELAGRIAAAYPHTKVVILTGFDQFEYAQQALRLQVKDFILKPITAREIRSLLGRLKEEMDEELRQREDISRLYSQLNQSLPLLKERFLERMVVTGVSPRELEERCRYFGIPPLEPGFLAVVFDFDDLADTFAPPENRTGAVPDAELLRFAGFNILQEIAHKEGGLAFRSREERMIVLLAGQTPSDPLQAPAFRLAEDARHQIEKYLKYTVTVGIGAVCSTAKELPLSYRSALNALEYRFLFGKNRVLSTLDVEGRPAAAPQPGQEWDRRIATAVKTGSLEDVRGLIRQFVAELKQSLLPIGACQLQIQKAVLALMNTLQELGLGGQLPHVSSSFIFSDIERFKTLDEIEAWLQRTVGSAMTAIADNRSHTAKKQALQAVAYIEENYADEALSLQSVCRHVLMSTSHFSLVFKQRTGETFVEYLTRVRLEKAKELLQEGDLKLYQIAERIGYSDANYFSMLFKKHTGKTPREYRDKLAKENRS